MKPIYIAAFHQSKFGKLMGMTVPEIPEQRDRGRLPPDRRPGLRSDVGSVGRGLQRFAQPAGAAGRPDGHDPRDGGKAHRDRRERLRFRWPGRAVGDL